MSAQQALRAPDMHAQNLRTGRIALQAHFFLPSLAHWVLMSLPGPHQLQAELACVQFDRKCLYVYVYMYIYVYMCVCVCVCVCVCGRVPLRIASPMRR
mmetsp:Transcript_28291/g.52844  ORF Transcript_28291/g.52844 Transcript_28291/m.52844 type:complete len:98 (+) Transcript_28291:1638-1931(+)